MLTMGEQTLQLSESTLQLIKNVQVYFRHERLKGHIAGATF